MKRLLLFTVFVFLCLPSFSQGEFNNWYFGFNCGISFNSNPPVAVTNGAVNISDQTSTISDASGNLIMYSDGLHVYNRNHIQMPNGFDLLGSGVTYSHASIIARKPGSTNLFYIFTLTYFAYPAGFKYAIVDMNLQGGLGDVISKNNALLAPVCEKLTAVKHQNGTDVWVITHQWNTDAFYAYLLTASGINSPVITHIGPTHSGGNYNAQGQMAASPDGLKIALAIYDDAFFEVYNFNNSTGVVSNQIQISGYSNAWGVQFSPDGTKLYGTKWTFAPVYQFNLLAGSPIAIANSATIVGNCTSPNPGYKAGFMQLAPDNKIYIAKMDAGYVAVINDPNALGTACNFIDNALFLAGKTCQAGLPQYIQTPFSIPDFTFLNVCQGTTVPFQSQNLSGYSSYNWNFGDPASGANNTSVLANPSHYFANPGIYTVTLIATQGSLVDTVHHNITIYPLPVVDLGNDTILCNGTSYSLNAANPGCTYLWSSGATTQSILVNTPGTYWVSVNNGYCSGSDTIVIDFQSLQVNIGNDTVICGATSYTLNAGNPGSTYLWSTGATTSSILVSVSGNYWVSVTHAGCSGIDSINLTLSQPPQISLGSDTTVCAGTAFSLDAGISGGTYLWSTGATIPNISVFNSGTYWVSVSNGNCSASDTIQINFQSLSVNLGNDTIICGASSHLLDAGNPGSSYLWSTGETSQAISVTGNGSYWVSVSNSVCSAMDTIQVSFSPPPTIDLGNDTTLCPGNTLTLNAGNPGAYYNWSTGSNSQNISIAHSGTYWIMVAIGNCFAYDTIQVNVIPQLYLGGEISLCDHPEIILSVPANDTLFTWSTGSTDTTITITEPGNYWLSIERDNCTLTDTLSVVGAVSYFFIPNAFTPNGDGINDLYGPVCEGIPEYHFMIFSSWGELIFETNDVNQWWDGKYKGKKVKMGVYTWVLDYRTACDTEKQHHKYGIVVVTK